MNYLRIDWDRCPSSFCKAAAYLLRVEGGLSSVFTKHGYNLYSWIPMAVNLAKTSLEERYG